MNPSRAALTRAEIATAEAMLTDGCSYREVARTIGHSHTTISRHLPGYGIALCERGRHSQMVRQLQELP